jgi:hypothetical protein
MAGPFTFTNKSTFTIDTTSKPADRTNIDDGWLQARSTITESLREKTLSQTTWPAIVVHRSDSSTDVPYSNLIGNPNYSSRNPQVKVYFRVDELHSNLPKPRSIEPDDDLKEIDSLSKLNPGAHEKFIISIHPYFYMEADEALTLDPKDIIEVKFDDDTWTFARFQKLIAKGPNNTPILGPFKSKSPSVADLFLDAATNFLGVQEPTSLGENQAKYYTEASRGPNEINNIVLHSTDGTSGPGRAAHTIHRFAEGPTLRFDWANKDTGETIANPSCDLVMAVDGALPEGTICHEKRKRVETPVKTSIHYAIDQGGNVIQGVLEKDIANHAGGYMNKNSIGIEMNGKPALGPGEGLDGKYAKMYNDQIIDATARLCAKIVIKYNIPIVRVTGKEPGIIGHYNISNRRFDPGNNLGRKSKDTPPGNYWDWDDFLARVKSYAGTS